MNNLQRNFLVALAGATVAIGFINTINHIPIDFEILSMLMFILLALLFRGVKHD